jgi:phosphoglycerol transferase MdoB-like AlkP superfamily enzyme
MLGSHCGVQPLPVDFTVESQARIYQPCLPSILKLFNHNKGLLPQKRRTSTIQSSGYNNFTSMPWKSVLVQAITDQFDHEDELNEHIGFSEVIVRDDLLNPLSKHYPPTEKESNYFGFSETEVKPYLQDMFREAEEKGQRLFMSHLTSSTHHPWNTPESAGKTVDYFSRRRWRPERPLNRYLNTIRYGDRWIGEIMDMLEDLGVAEKTLVVIVGDQ